ncbi:MAG: hypothetical protein ACK6AT_02290 [Planctomycetota bacterium]
MSKVNQIGEAENDFSGNTSRRWTRYAYLCVETQINFGTIAPQ